MLICRNAEGVDGQKKLGTLVQYAAWRILTQDEITRAALYHSFTSKLKRFFIFYRTVARKSSRGFAFVQRAWQ